MAALLSVSELLTSLVMILITTCIFGNTNKNIIVGVEGATTTWCVTRSDASTPALQAALDYSCAAGADCVPIQSNGLCYLPNTIQAHASYAFNSYYQRKAMAPGSCDFSGTATIAQTDPSYGSCVYPSSLSTAGGTSTTPTTTTTTTPTTTITNSPTTPTTTAPTFGGLTPGMTPTIPDSDNSKASPESMITTILIPVSFVLVLLFT